MGIKIIGDSLFDLNEELKRVLSPIIVPLSFTIGEKSYIDDGSVSIKKILADMKAFEGVPKTASPSPHGFLKAFERAADADIYCITIASIHSSTHKHAQQAKKLYQTKFKDRFIHVFDSKTVSGGETLIGIKIHELDRLNVKAEEMIERINKYIDEMKTFFVLESLDNLVKSGRLSRVAAKIGSVLSIRPVMQVGGDGSLSLYEKVRGTKKALRKLVSIIGEQGDKLEEKILSISHCNCLERAEWVKAEILKRYNFKDIVIIETGGISSIYANDGGIIISF